MGRLACSPWLPLFPGSSGPGACTPHSLQSNRSGSLPGVHTDSLQQQPEERSSQGPWSPQDVRKPCWPALSPPCLPPLSPCGSLSTLLGHFLQLSVKTAAPKGGSSSHSKLLKDCPPLWLPRRPLGLKGLCPSQCLPRLPPPAYDDGHHPLLEARDHGGPQGPFAGRRVVNGFLCSFF